MSKIKNKTIAALYNHIALADQDARLARETLAKRLSDIIDDMHHKRGIAYAHIARVCEFPASYISDLRAGRRLLTREQATRVALLASAKEMASSSKNLP